MIQALLYELLTDADSVAQVEHARTVYSGRQARLAEDLGRERPGDGLNMWLGVADERDAVVQLAASGILVAPGGPFQLGEPGGFVRVTIGMAREDLGTVTSALAGVAAVGVAGS